MYAQNPDDLDVCDVKICVLAITEFVATEDPSVMIQNHSIVMFLTWFLHMAF